MKLIFRADGNAEIGLGHVIRSLALADMLKDDFECVFATCYLSEYLKEEILKSCASYVQLSEKNHFNEFLNLLQGNEIVVLDNYFFTTNYQERIKEKGCKLVCIDDLHDRHFVADAVINHIIGIQPAQYSVEKYTKLLLGFEYSLLRSEFLNKTKLNKNKEFSVLVMMGGADPNNLTIPIIDILNELRLDLPMAVVYKGKILKGSSRYVQFRDVSSAEVVRLMNQSVMGVLPASSVAIEACACRLPFVTGFFVNNQVGLYKNLTAKNVAVGLGDFSQNMEQIKNLVLDLYQNTETRNKLIGEQKLILDKKSAQRFRYFFNELSHI